MTEPKWKRALDDLLPNPAPVKRQKSASPSESALVNLDNGLIFVESSHDISDEAKEHARQLRRLIIQNSSNSPTNGNSPSNGDVHVNGDAKKVEKNDHTAVPPPFPLNQTPAPVATTNSSAAPNSTTKRLPPLPPITDLTLLSAPFTHTSTLPHYMPATNTNTYEPLEFLGDAYLELIATRLIHERFPQHTVGQKSGLREILIRNDTLASYSREYGFGDRVKVIGIERADTNSKAWVKIQADVFEAYVACVILSDDQNGFKIAEKWLWELWEPRVLEWREKGDGKNTGDQEHASSDVKSMLQRYVVAKGVKLEYLEERPMEHIKDGNRTTFFMGVYLTGWGYNKVRLGSGSGRSKQIAGAEAAKDAFITGGTIVRDSHQKKLDHDRSNKKARPVV
jgi:ribonuclease III